MTVRLVSTSGAPPALEIEKAFIGSLNKQGRVVLGSLMQQLRKRLEVVGTRHYQNLGSAIKAQLRHGFPYPSSGGSRKVKAYDGSDKPVTYTTGYWPELSHPYVRRAPVSTRMWRKRGFLSNEVSKDLPKGRMKVRALRKKYRVVDPQKRRVKASYLMLFPVLGGKALQDLMIKPFIYGDESVASGFSTYGLDKNSSDLLGYPEAATQAGNPRKKRPGPMNRPWVAGFSGLLGQRMRTAVRKL